MGFFSKKKQNTSTTQSKAISLMDNPSPEIEGIWNTDHFVQMAHKDGAIYIINLVEWNKTLAANKKLTGPQQQLLDHLLNKPHGNNLPSFNSGEGKRDGYFENLKNYEAMVLVYMGGKFDGLGGDKGRYHNLFKAISAVNAKFKVSVRECVDLILVGFPVRETMLFLGKSLKE